MEGGVFDNDDHQIDYVKGELVGQGAYGKVYQGLDISNGQLLAIKNIQVSISIFVTIIYSSHSKLNNFKKS
jgi:serine/threonine protein kinase